MVEVEVDVEPPQSVSSEGAVNLEGASETSSEADIALQKLKNRFFGDVVQSRRVVRGVR